MTAITTEACEAAMDKARSQDTPDEAAAIKRQSFVCKRRGREVSPAQCSDCFEAMSYTERFKYHEKRSDCIKENKLNPKLAKRLRGKSKKGRAVEEKTPVKPDSAKELAPLNSQLNIGDSVEIKEKGQESIRVQITKEMAEDRDAALKLVTQAAQDKMRSELLMNVGIALYAGDAGKSIDDLVKESGLVHHSGKNHISDAITRSDRFGREYRQPHVPWVIDGFTNFEDACRETFGLKRQAIYYRRAIGMALIAQYGKENVVAKAEELGIARIPQYKLRELLKAPEFFEQLCTRGYARLENKQEIAEVTIDYVLEAGIDKLSELITRFMRAPTGKGLAAIEAAGTAKDVEDPFKEWGDGENPLAQAPLVQKEKLMAENLQYLISETKRLNKEVGEIFAGWPPQAAAIFSASPLLQDMVDEALQPLSHILSAFVVAESGTWDNEEAQLRLRGKYRDQLSED